MKGKVDSSVKKYKNTLVDWVTGKVERAPSKDMKNHNKKKMTQGMGRRQVRESLDTDPRTRSKKNRIMRKNPDAIRSRGKRAISRYLKETR